MAEQLDKQFALRMTSDLHAEIEMWAKEEFRSVNSQIIAILRDAVAERRKQRATRRRAEGSAQEPDIKTPILNAAFTT